MSAINLYRGLFELLTVPPDGDAPALATAEGGRRELLSVAPHGGLPARAVCALGRGRPAVAARKASEHEQLARRRAAGGRGAARAAARLAAGRRARRAARREHAGSAARRLRGHRRPCTRPLGRLGYRLHGAGEWLVPLRGPMHRGVASVRYDATGTSGAPSPSTCRSAASRSTRAATCRSPISPRHARGSTAAPAARWRRRASCCIASPAFGARGDAGHGAPDRRPPPAAEVRRPAASTLAVAAAPGRAAGGVGRPAPDARRHRRQAPGRAAVVGRVRPPGRRRRHAQAEASPARRPRRRARARSSSARSTTAGARARRRHRGQAGARALARVARAGGRPSRARRAGVDAALRRAALHAHRRRALPRRPAPA